MIFGIYYIPYEHAMINKRFGTRNVKSDMVDSPYSAYRAFVSCKKYIRLTLGGNLSRGVANTCTLTVHFLCCQELKKKKC